ncbi:MAG: beta-ketoacyl-ACP synthase III [Alphaproteobacteria bacterium]|nr:beta-ketoacyl-ACP synthase III [Alphaproteobacteria bacterium]
MIAAAISATGLFTPPFSISNEELVASYNAYAERFNRENAEAIAAGRVEALELSSTEFIEKASGIKSRYVMNKEGILDIDFMHPRIPDRPNEQLSIMAEMGVAAAKDALTRAGRDARDVDAVICAASNMQRAYPAIGIEIQDALGIGGYAFDLVCGCGSAAYGIATAVDMVRVGRAKSVLVVSPEITSAHNNHQSRDSHFIFGDLCTAVLVEAADVAPPHAWAVLGVKLKSQFSNNIRNNYGFLNICDPEGVGKPDKLFVQEGRKVFKEVVPLVSEMILSHMAELNLAPNLLRRMWLHQANSNMIRLISQRVLGREATEDESPSVLHEYANTSSAGAVIAFHKHSDDLKPGERGLICAFGAGYSAATIFVAKAA